MKPALLDLHDQTAERMKPLTLRLIGAMETLF